MTVITGLVPVTQTRGQGRGISGPPTPTRRHRCVWVAGTSPAMTIIIDFKALADFST
jgi:hypothetical protein